MSSEPFLIAHLVRGQPAFDIAIRLDMPDEDGDEWWIIPTSGHRAYPYQTLALNEIEDRGTGWLMPAWMKWATDTFLIEGWPDHYPHSASPTPTAKLDLRSLGLSRPKPKIARRI